MTKIQKGSPKNCEKKKLGRKGKSFAVPTGERLAGGLPWPIINEKKRNVGVVKETNTWKKIREIFNH